MKMIALSFPVFSPYKKWPLRNKSLLERKKTETIDYKQKDTIQFYKKPLLSSKKTRKSLRKN
jgi:hypothetical protein